MKNCFHAVILDRRRYSRRVSDIAPDKWSPSHKVFVPVTKVVQRDRPESGSTEHFAGMRADISSAADHQMESMRAWRSAAFQRRGAASGPLWLECWRRPVALSAKASPPKAAEAVRPCTSAALPKADVNSTHWPPTLCAKSGREQLQQIQRYSITSSAMASSDGGTSMPSACAVCRLRANSNLVDCSTGSSAGLAPLRMLPV